MRNIIRPEDLDPASRERIIVSFKRRKRVRNVLRAIAAMAVILVFASWRYGVSLTGVPSASEYGIFLGIGGLFLVISVLYWRCPHCGWHFLWRLNPVTCWNCGVRLVVPRPKPVETNEANPPDYIAIRKKNSLKYWLLFFLVWGANMGLMGLLVSVVPIMVLLIIYIVTLWVPLTLLENKYLVCPKCGEKYARWWDRSRVPQVCSNCKTMLKPYSRFW